MKISESWLREWVNPKRNRDELSHDLTMSGLEVDEVAPVADQFSGVVIGEVLRAEKHPEADRLTLCDVSIGNSNHLKIVCGANNVRVNMKVPVAVIGAKLANNTEIKPAKIRGVPSEGMLCSASELGLVEESQGLLVLDQAAPLGEDLRKYLNLDDYTFDISITPNRGDCLSVKGVAREIAAITHVKLTPVTIPEIKYSIKDTLPVSIKSKAGCRRYVGRVIRNVKADATTPVWLQEKLRRSGSRSISPIVDVTNYVMLELGQPMHAFDLNTINKEIIVRQSRQGEKITLLDGTTKVLDDNSLIIADHENPLAIAGVMGGLDSSVTSLTRDIFLESAFFSPKVIAKQRQYYGLNSDSSYRFERGIDPTKQREAIERATQLILEMVGGEAGPVIEEMDANFPPAPLTITLTAVKLKQVLGIEVPDTAVAAIFNALEFSFKHDKEAWHVSVPSFRSDITIPEDLIEEIARLYGYDNIPTHPMRAQLQSNSRESAPDLHPLRQAFRDQGYHEVITYSFIGAEWRSKLFPDELPTVLMNPITAEMTEMRVSLWPGLINTYLYNRARQQQRVRLFEIGTCFLTRGNELTQVPKIGGLIAGSALPEQWGVATKEVDFYDLKGDMENILGISYPLAQLDFRPEAHSALHPGQTAGIYVNDAKIGLIGALHPTVMQALDVTGRVFVFELDLALLKARGKRLSSEISKFPEIRRDLAIIANQAIPAKAIQDTIRIAAGDWLKEVFIFDLYQGQGISPGNKSIALGLVLQHPARTLIDAEVAALMERVITALKEQFGAELRS